MLIKSVGLWNHAALSFVPFFAMRTSDVLPPSLLSSLVKWTDNLPLWCEWYARMLLQLFKQLFFACFSFGRKVSILP